MGAFLNSYLAYAFPALIIVMTPNRVSTLIASASVTLIICIIIFLKIFGTALTAEYGPAYAQWQGSLMQSALLLAANFALVVLCALFFKGLTMVASGKPAKYLQYGAFLGPLPVLYSPDSVIWMDAALLAALASLAGFEIWRRRLRPRIPRNDVPPPVMHDLGEN